MNTTIRVALESYIFYNDSAGYCPRKKSATVLKHYDHTMFSVTYYVTLFTRILGNILLLIFTVSPAKTVSFVEQSYSMFHNYVTTTIGNAPIPAFYEITFQRVDYPWNENLMWLSYWGCPNDCDYIRLLVVDVGLSLAIHIYVCVCVCQIVNS